MGKYTVTEVSCSTYAGYGCLAEYEVHLYANGDIGGNMMTVKADIENIEDVKWPTITVNTNGLTEKDLAKQIALISRGSGESQFALIELAKAAGGFYNLQIKRVLYNPPATIVFWADGTKTVVKCQEGDKFDHEKGVALCFMKKALGNQSNFNNTLNKWLPAFLKEEEK